MLSQDPYVQGFFAAFGSTGVALAIGMALGRARKIPAHIAAIATFLLLFLVTVGFAEAVGRRYHFEKLSKIVHLPLAISAAFAAFGPVVTGWRRWREQGSLRAHRIAIVVFLGLFVLATGTGLNMLSTAVPKQ
jgi:hypothetical protein